MTVLQRALVRLWRRDSIKLSSVGRVTGVFAVQGGKHPDEGASGW
jgi:hypothetical protein